MEKFKSFEESAYLNNKTYSAFFIQLYSIALTCFNWVNLPKTIDERFLEKTLFWRGLSVFFTDEIIGHLALPALAIGPLNVYDVPTNITAYAANGYQKMGLTLSDSVLIYNNYTRTPDAEQIKIFAMRLYDIQRAIDTNIKAQKTPVLIRCTEKERLTLKNLYMQYDGNAPVIFSSKNFDPTSMTVLKTDAPFVSSDLQVMKRQVFMEALTYLGIEANTAEKAERLVSGEITSNMGPTEAYRQSRLKARKQACEMINDMFDLEIDVKFNSELNLSKIAEGEPLNGNEGLEE